MVRTCIESSVVKLLHWAFYIGGCTISSIVESCILLLICDGTYIHYLITESYMPFLVDSYIIATAYHYGAVPNLSAKLVQHQSCVYRIIRLQYILSLQSISR